LLIFLFFLFFFIGGIFFFFLIARGRIIYNKSFVPRVLPVLRLELDGVNTRGLVLGRNAYVFVLYPGSAGTGECLCFPFQKIKWASAVLG